MQSMADIGERVHRSMSRHFGAGRVVVYTPVGGSAVTLDPAPPFTDTHEVVTFDGEGLAVSTTRPALYVCVADLPAAPQQKDRVTVDGVTYEVTDVQATSDQGATLMLVKR